MFRNLLLTRRYNNSGGPGEGGFLARGRRGFLRSLDGFLEIPGFLGASAKRAERLGLDMLLRRGTRRSRDPDADEG